MSISDFLPSNLSDDLSSNKLESRNFVTNSFIHPPYQVFSFNFYLLYLYPNKEGKVFAKATLTTQLFGIYYHIFYFVKL